MSRPITRLEMLFREAGLSQRDVGDVIGVSQSAVANKLAGRRRWNVHEVQHLLPFLSLRLGRTVTLDDLLPGD